MAYEEIDALTVKVNPSDAGLDMADFLSNVKTSNELSYQSSPSRSSDMTLRNDEEAFYVPTIEITLGYLTPEIYSEFLQIVNSKGFFVSYFDQELGETVFRAVYMSEKSLERLHTSAGASLDGLVGVEVKMVSRYGYPYTKASDGNCNKAGKYHMYQLHAHRTPSDYNPTGEEAPNYV